MPYRIVRRLDEDIFQLKVGSTQQVFIVHQQILAKSPVLARMTTSGFSESITREINLPEDDEDIFGRVVEFLYDNEREAFNFSPLDELGSAEKLAKMYLLADKYDLIDLQKSITAEIKKIKLWKKDPLAFFDTAYLITQNCQDFYRIFHSFYVIRAVKLLKIITPEEIMIVSDMIDTDGTFAKWTFEAQARLRREDDVDWLDKMRLSSGRLLDAQRGLTRVQKQRSEYLTQLKDVQEMQSKFKAELEKRPPYEIVTIQWVHDLFKSTCNLENISQYSSH